MYWNGVLPDYYEWWTGLTLTWDVLKCSILADTAEPNVKININMRCIEILNDDFKRRYVKD